MTTQATTKNDKILQLEQEQDIQRAFEIKTMIKNLNNEIAEIENRIFERYGTLNYIQVGDISITITKESFIKKDIQYYTKQQEKLTDELDAVNIKLYDLQNNNAEPEVVERKRSLLFKQRGDK